MTCERGIIGIFRQNENFWNVLVVSGARVKALTVYGATCKTAGSLEG
jgi:hypothetical protein